MTIGNVKFYKMKGSLSSGEYPLFSTGQDLSTYLIHTASVKFAKGLQTVVKVPSFTGYETVNIAEMDGEFYWVTAWHESSTANMTIEFVLDFMGPTSFFRSTDTAKGSWHKTPSNVCPYLKNEITNGHMAIASSQSITTIPDLGFTRIGSVPYIGGYWVQITGFTSSARTTLKKIGLFMGANKTNGEPSERMVAGSSGERYPSFDDLILNLTAETGIAADQVIDCSISKRCPYAMTATLASTDPLGPIYYWAYLNGASSALVQTSAGHYVYDLSNYTPTENGETITVTLTDYQRACGSVDIRDWNDNVIANIPMLGSTLTFSVAIHSDIGGVYTIIRCNDMQISVPEGKLPYIENAWETYKAYQMNSDRQAMENAIRYAAFNKDTATTTGTVNAISGGASTGVMTGAIAGNPAGAAVGILTSALGAAVNVYEQKRSYELSVMQARQSQKLTEKRAMDAPQTSYNVGYGLIYCYLNEHSSLRVCINEPYDTDSSYYTAWCDQYGYPAEGVFSATIANGYYEGSLVSDADTKSGMYWDECNKTFMNGFKFISP